MYSVNEHSAKAIDASSAICRNNKYYSVLVVVGTRILHRTSALRGGYFISPIKKCSQSSLP